MILLNPKKHERKYPDKKSREIMLKTIEFFENKGLRSIKDDDHKRTWYREYLDFIKENKIFATLLTPSKYSDDPDARWDTYRNCEFNEIISFYGLAYWYTWQVTILGLGPIWMSRNEGIKKKAAKALKEGGIFAFGLSERDHGADVYSTEMTLTPRGEGKYAANGEKYYIGNGNEAAMVSTFAKIAGTGDYAFFIANFKRREYELKKNVCDSQNYVANYALHDYPVTDAEILVRGDEALHTALNTVNVGKYNLGWASIGICTHSFYEAINHAANRVLYGMHVTDFPHVKQMFTDAYCRLVAMKLVALRTSDYQRTASIDDRRYLLYNPVVKMKVTSQGEDVITALWDVIAAKGFEKDTYFEMAARDIRALPRLEGTVHVNIALIVKFMENYFFNPGTFPEIGKIMHTGSDEFLFNQGPARGLGRIQFHDYRPVFDRFDIPNVNVFQEQIEVFRQFLAAATPDDEQKKDIDFLMSLGEIFTLVVYGQLMLEEAGLQGLEADLIDQIFDVMVRDFSKFAVELYGKPSSTTKQMEYCLKMIKKPAIDKRRYENIWTNHVHALKDAYVMNQ
ncbi:MAG: acyl-CoA dehydrogenase [Chloroflexi bacterium]|nr:acyl-CoA dehydrogenase [Chloroflexota bacterium]